jgi:hypothetical protein
MMSFCFLMYFLLFSIPHPGTDLCGARDPSLH